VFLFSFPSYEGLKKKLEGAITLPLIVPSGLATAAQSGTKRGTRHATLTSPDLPNLGDL